MWGQFEVELSVRLSMDCDRNYGVGMAARELLILTMVWPRHVAPRAGDIHRHKGQDYRITGFLPDQRDDWFHKSITLTLETI